MKYVVIIPDGASDFPIEQLSGKTPFQAAHIPRMDEIAHTGTTGSVRTVPAGLKPGSDVAIMSVIGYDPSIHYTGRAPLEAAAMEVDVGSDDWVLRCNLVHVEDGKMNDHSAGAISTEEARPLIDELNNRLAGESYRFFGGVGYRNLLLWKSDLTVSTTPPHDILGKDCQDFLPEGKDAGLLIDLMDRGKDVLASRPSSKANGIWFWGQGKRTELPSFSERYGVHGAVITAVDLVRGLGRLVGWQIRDVPGATGYYDTDYRGKGAEAIASLAKYDLVCVHIEATDEAGHAGDWSSKVAALEAIDANIVGPVWDMISSSSIDARVLILPDHPTPCALRTHTSDPVPYCMAGSDVKKDSTTTFSEGICNEFRGRSIEGCRLMQILIDGPTFH